ncbi:RNA-binding protein 28 [Venturia canescens]|uniref:RNA-binding protein 28 n=1 Tax=Venturia canescens TaxID=32260 RepID=UPI001C9C516A|nr:RNA-binding protein 28 [Venturia canescens]
MGKPGGGFPRKDGQKLSWSYRNKKRQARNNKEGDGNTGQENVQVQNKKARIVVRNLSFKATENDVRRLYEPFGEIEQIDLLKRPDGKLVGCGFVQFKRVEDASKAIFNTNKKELLGRPINTAWAISKSKYIEQIGDKTLKKENLNGESSSKENEEEIDNEEVYLDNEQNVESELNGDTEVISKGKKGVSKRVDRKVQKLRKAKKRARIVIRNLAFQVTEEALREHFSKYGTIEEIKILTKPDGKRLGCGFIQYKLAQDASKAVHFENMKPLLGRPMVVDKAVAKTKFDKATTSVEVKSEIEEIEIKSDPEEKDSKVISEDANGSEESDEDDIKEEISSEDEDSDGSIKKEKNGSVEGTENEDEEDEIQDDRARPRVISNDVNEGKTVFLKNVPFAVKNEELRERMEQYGPVYYALICMDPLTEHSKGTAFVKFRNVEDAEKCLSAGTELRLHDQVLDPHRALNRNAVQDNKSLKKEKIKDSRNLYLVKEGVILAGSPAAVGVSVSDMAKRLQMEQWKSQMLRNLNMFVSRVRLVVHNLPPTLNDSQLREIFKKHAGPKAFIQEARVMRDLKNVDEKGVGKSKEFGFVAFTNHEDALKALRSINNNPNIFSKTKRPIVAFSIENRVMVNAKKRRITKSREHNPLWNGEKTDSKTNEPVRKRVKVLSAPKDSVEASAEYSGIKSKPGEQKMRSRYNLKSQAMLHQKMCKTEKKKVKETKKIQAKKREMRASRQEVKPKQGSKKITADEANFNKLVNNYKSKLQAVPSAKSKWYDT